MKQFFRHKHQNLIEQCYPPGKAIDKKANPSELSYLLYYASTRRVKLEKIIKYLHTRTIHHANHNKTGNLQVTLQIVKKLIEACADNLNVIAEQICQILKIVLDTKDISLCKSAVQTYGVFCENLEGPLFTGDKDFVIKFTQVSQIMISYGKCESGPNQYEWQMISLLAISHICKCLGHNASVSRKFILMSIPMLAGMIHYNSSQQSILQRLRSNVNVESNRLSRVVLSKTHRQIDEQIIEDFENDTLTLSDITEAAFSAMKAFFDTNSTNLILEATKELVNHNIKNGVDLECGVTFFELCISWVPVQLRFIGLSTLLNTLTENTKFGQESNYQLQYQYSRYLLALLSSNINMIGLSVADIIQQLLELQNDLIFKPKNLSNKESETLTDIYSDCICNLTTHIYYYDQVPDSIQEILLKIELTLDGSFVDPVDGPASPTSPEQIHSLIVQFLTNISKIFTILRSKTSSINRNHVNLEQWEHVLDILAPESEYKDRNTILSIKQINDIQLRFLRVFGDFLNNELTSIVVSLNGSIEMEQNGDQKDSSSFVGARRNSADLSGTAANESGNHLLSPNVNRYISVQQNFITHFLMYVEKFIESYPNPMPELLTALTTVLKDMIEILGMNFLANFIPFFHHWGISSKDHSETEILRDTLAYTLMYYSVKSLDDQYTKDLDDYAKESKLFGLIMDAIHFRKKNEFWVANIEGSESELETAIGKRVVKASNQAKVSKEDIEEFACGNNSLVVWLHPQKPYLTELERSGTGGLSDFGNDHIHNNTDHNLLPAVLVTNSGPVSDNLSSENSEKGVYTGLGLGTAGDISNIQSEIVQFSQVFPQRAFPLHGQDSIMNVLSARESNVSSFTADSKGGIAGPRVVDLKDLMNPSPGPPPPGVRRGSISSSVVAPGSILHKHMLCNDVSSILDGLDSDDDAAIVV